MLAGRLGQVGERRDVGDFGLAGRDIWCRGNRELSMVFMAAVQIVGCTAWGSWFAVVELFCMEILVCTWLVGARRLVHEAVQGSCKTRAGRCWVRVKLEVGNLSAPGAVSPGGRAR